MKQNIQIETKFNFAVCNKIIYSEDECMKKDETRTTVIRPEWNIT